MDHQYLHLMRKVFQEGDDRMDRTGTGIRSLFGHQMRHNLADGFPMITTKKVHFKSVAHELLWFLKGSGNVKYLQDHGVRIWNEWADENGDLGPVYGVQWRQWKDVKGETHDQIKDVIEQIKTNPSSRRLIVNAWNVGQLSEMALPPCHMMMQFYVSKGKLSCQLYQRSADIFLGVPFNIASYALLTHMMAQVCDLEVGEFVHTFGDVHIYHNHFKQVETQLERAPRDLPRLKITPTKKKMDDFVYDDFDLVGYNPHPHIAGKVSV